MNTRHSFVTGATGFIGVRLTRHLIQLGHRVTCLARNSSRTRPLVEAGAAVVHGDVTDHSSLCSALNSACPDTVFHLAGIVKAVRTNDFTAVNALGTRNTALACAALPAPPVLLLVSSLAAAGPSPDGVPLLESAVPRPVSRYGQSKLAGEQEAFAVAKDLPVTIVRPPIVFGPGDLGVFQIFEPIARIHTHMNPGHRDSRFSLIFVDDLVHALALAALQGERLAAASPGQGIYYAAADETPGYAQLGNLIAAALGQKPPRQIRVPGPLLKIAALGADTVSWAVRRAFWLNSDKIIEATAGDWIVSSDKARRQLNWLPAAPLADRLLETAQWYKAEKWL